MVLPFGSLALARLASLGAGALSVCLALLAIRRVDVTVAACGNLTARRTRAATIARCGVGAAEVIALLTGGGVGVAIATGGHLAFRAGRRCRAAIARGRVGAADVALLPVRCIGMAVAAGGCLAL